MMIFMIDRKISYYAVYFENDFDEETINEIYKNSINKSENDATLITDIQCRTNKSRIKGERFMNFKFDYLRNSNKKTKEMKEIEKQQMIDIFARLKFVKVYEECLDNISTGIQLEKLFKILPNEQIYDKSIMANSNSNTLYNVLNILKEEKIVDANSTVKEILKPGNADDLFVFITKNQQKDKPKFTNHNKTKKLKIVSN